VPPQAPGCAWCEPRCEDLWCRAEPECRSSLPEFLFTSCSCGLSVIPTGPGDQGEPASAAATAAAAAAACGRDVTHWWAWFNMCPPLLVAIAPCIKSLCTIFTEESPLYPPDTEVTAVLPGCMSPTPRSECTMEPVDRILLLARYGLEVAVAIPQTIKPVSYRPFPALDQLLFANRMLLSNNKSKL
jgi:hypothetical protein